MTTCAHPTPEPCAWGACPECHTAHLCQPLERVPVLASGHHTPSLTYAEETTT